MITIDFNNSYCLFNVTPTANLQHPDIVPHSWRQKTICKAELAKKLQNGKLEVTTTYYLNHFCAGERVYKSDMILYDERTNETPYLFTTIYQKDETGGLIKLINIGVDPRTFSGRVIPCRNEYNYVYRATTVLERKKNYKKLLDANAIKNATFAGKELIGMSEYDCSQGEYKWVVTYPINYMNVSPSGEYQVDAGAVLFFNEAEDVLNNVHLAFIAYNNVKVNTEFLVYLDSYPQMDEKDYQPLLSLQDYLEFAKKTTYSQLIEKTCQHSIYSYG